MYSSVPYLFPSLPWFRALAAKAEEPACAEHFRRLGVVDTAFAVRAGDLAYRLVFDGFVCSEVTEWDGEAPVDFVLDASLQDWEDLVEQLHEGGAPSLNSLVLADERFHLRGDDQLGVDNFYRYNASLQAFLDLAADVRTVYRQAA